jgi:hypothetical protein
MFPWRRILRNELVKEHVSWYTKMNKVTTGEDSWKPARCCVINRQLLGYGVQMVSMHFHGYRYAV